MTCSTLCFSPVSCLFAQVSQPTRLVDFVSPSVLSRRSVSPPAVCTNVDLFAEARDQGLCDLIKRTTTTPADRWLKFEGEYGIREESPSPIGRIFQVAKYGLDRVTFTAQETARRLEFTYDVGDVPASDTSSRSAAPQYSLPMFGRFGHAQLKSVVTVHDSQTGEAFVGLKLAVPFGQGG